MAEAESGERRLRGLRRRRATPEAIALALSAMTFAIGRRFLIVDGVERWKDAEVGARSRRRSRRCRRDDGRLLRARGRAGQDAGQARRRGQEGGRRRRRRGHAEGQGAPALGGRRGRAARHQLEGAAAKALVAHVGERQQRLLRELEKLALEHGQGAHIGVEEVEAVAAPSAERQVWGLVDALVAGDGGAPRARSSSCAPRASRCRASCRSWRAACATCSRSRRAWRRGVARSGQGLDEGSPWAADRRIKEARATDAEALRARARGARRARGRQPRPERAGRRHRGAAGDRDDRRVARRRVRDRQPRSAAEVDRLVAAARRRADDEDAQALRAAGERAGGAGADGAQVLLVEREPLPGVVEDDPAAAARRT